ncbi:unnamed protein product, partial [marine sediment metagenome]
GSYTSNCSELPPHQNLSLLSYPISRGFAPFYT